MSVQNYLSNVFKPVYMYDPATTLFTPKLELSNIDTYSGNAIAVSRAGVGDSNSNVYVGTIAGSLTGTTNCVNNTAVGYGAANDISNVSNSVYIGYFAGAQNQSATNVISIGANSGGVGSSNIFIGTNTATAGTKNILLGHYLTPSNVSNQIRIGYSNQVPIAADLSSGWVGLGGVVTPTTGTGVDVSGSIRVSGLSTCVSGIVSIQSNGVVPNGSTAVIAPIRRGTIMVSAVDQAAEVNRAAAVFFAYTTLDLAFLSTLSNGSLSISNVGSDIVLSNASAEITCDYSVTYFPLP